MVTWRTVHGPVAGGVRNSVVAAVAVATLGAAPLLSPGVAAAAEAATDLPAYEMAKGAKPISGAASRTKGPRLAPGTYKDTIGHGEKKFYSVPLDAKSSAFVSAVAAPEPGSEVAAYRDGIKVALEDSSGLGCDSAQSSFEGGGVAYPLSDYATRRIDPRRASCRQAGSYLFSVERSGKALADADRWPVEIKFMVEPGLKGSVPTEQGQGQGQGQRQGSRDAAGTAPPTGVATKEARGGTGFNDAGAVADGVWRDRIRPGETRFYRVPVDWGQRLDISAEVPDTGKEEPNSLEKEPRSTRLLRNAFGLSVYNPARGPVSGMRFAHFLFNGFEGLNRVNGATGVNGLNDPNGRNSRNSRNSSYEPYEGEPTVVQQHTAPVEYGNRFIPSESIGAMRFAGWYYLEVTAHQDMARFFKGSVPLTLRVDVAGSAQRGPEYDGDAVAAGFGITDEDRAAAGKGLSADEAGSGGALRAVAYGGIGVGVLLLAGLGGWTVAARRRAAGGCAAEGVPAERASGRASGRASEW